MKKYSIKLTREEINLDELDIPIVKCTGKSIFNIVIALMFFIAGIACIISLSNEMLNSINGVLSYIFINLLFIIPLIYLLLKIINYSFVIEGKDITYKNIFGNTFKYDIKDIKYVKRLINRRPEVFMIKMGFGKTIIISDYSSGFELLKLKLKKEKLI